MTLAGSSDNRPSKNQRRGAAREKAKALREAQRRKDRRNKFLVQGGVVFGIVAIVAIVALILVNTLKPAGPGPKNMASGGIIIGKNLVAERAPAQAVTETPVSPPPDTSTGVVSVRMYIDYLCPVCGVFEATNGAQIKDWLNSGAITLDIHPIAMLVSSSAGTKYSLRAANAAACVANYSPDQFFDFNSLMFEDQPKEGTPGRSDKELQQITKRAKVENQSAINRCINDQQFKAWALAEADRVIGNPLPNSNVTRMTGTPTVIVNGMQFPGGSNDADAFAQFIQRAAASAYTTATPSPSASASPTP